MERNRDTEMMKQQAVAGQPDSLLNSLLVELKQRLSELYQDRLAGVVLYGSYARGSAHPGSDLDVAMLLDGYERAWLEIDRTGSLVAEMSLKYGVTVSLIPVRKKDWDQNQTLLTRSLRREGILIG
jgi:predicted nucleotidyltransferase